MRFLTSGDAFRVEDPLPFIGEMHVAYLPTDRVMEIDAPLAEALTRCARRSAYTEILKALNACEDLPVS